MHCIFRCSLALSLDLFGSSNVAHAAVDDNADVFVAADAIAITVTTTVCSL